MDDKKLLEILIEQMAKQMKIGQETADAIKSLPAVDFNLVIKKLI